MFSPLSGGKRCERNGMQWIITAVSFPYRLDYITNKTGEKDEMDAS